MKNIKKLLNNLKTPMFSALFIGVAILYDLSLSNSGKGDRDDYTIGYNTLFTRTEDGESNGLRLKIVLVDQR